MWPRKRKSPSNTLCENCGEDAVTIIDSRLSQDNQIRRRRHCHICKHRWSTLEISVKQYEKLIAINNNLKSVKDLISSIEGEKDE